VTPSGDHVEAGLVGADEASAAAFRAFHRALRLHRRALMQAFAAHGIHHGQAMCLRLLADGEATQRDLAGELHVSSPTGTRMVTSMERAGLVRRYPDEADARLVRVELTDAGRAQEREMRAAAGEYVERTFATLTEGERRDLARLLDTLADRIAEVAPAKDPADLDARPAGPQDLCLPAEEGDSAPAAGAEDGL
jgi:DNA-binding MarR family transcriptional regulator